LNDTYKNTLDIIPNGVVIIDIETKEITYANKELKTIVGDKSDSNSSELLKDSICKFFLYQRETSNKDEMAASDLLSSSLNKIEKS